ncbi:MAG TPA: cupin domain-containing protein [Gaiellaceae bacterium]|nr:cupin domain-containing protein [Gaiellaceae bacterium]
MRVVARDELQAFTTKDGSEIREFHHTAAQSLAEASLAPGQSTQRHYHRASEEIYVVLEGEGELEIAGERRRVGAGDAALIPAGDWHEISATSPLRFLCCCAPPYSHDDTFFE